MAWAGGKHELREMPLPYLTYLLLLQAELMPELAGKPVLPDKALLPRKAGKTGRKTAEPGMAAESDRVGPDRAVTDTAADPGRAVRRL